MSINNENVKDDWEQYDEREFEDKLEQLKKDNSANKMNADRKICLLRPDDDQSLGPPAEPSVKILRRPTQNDDKISIDSNKPKAPKKTLKQREQEYAEARLRILGAARSPDEDLTEQNRLSSPTIRTANILTNGTTGIPPASSTNLGQNENVIRMPMGPDGTSGFKIRR